MKSGDRVCYGGFVVWLCICEWLDLHCGGAEHDNSISICMCIREDNACITYAERYTIRERSEPPYRPATVDSMTRTIIFSERVA